MYYVSTTKEYSKVCIMTLAGTVCYRLDLDLEGREMTTIVQDRPQGTGDFSKDITLWFLKRGEEHEIDEIESET